MRGRFTGWFGFIMIVVSIVLTVLSIVDGMPWAEAVHKNGPAMALSTAQKAEALAKRGKDRIP